MKVILVDIEGTITDIDFVKQTLFPYASQNLARYVREQTALNNPQVQTILDDTLAFWKNEQTDPHLKQDPTVDDLIQILLSWIDADRKITPLKTLQGLIWEHGYTSGDFTGHLYEDAYTYLKKWKDQGLRLAVYSSGSEYAQKLLLGHSDYGDLTPWFEAYFDTRVGAKREAQAYGNILKALGLDNEAHQVLFLSDVVQELDAAHQVGMKTYELRRDQQEGSSHHPVASHFEHIDRTL